MHLNVKMDVCSSTYVCVCVYIYAAKSLQSCPTLCDPIDGSLPGSPVPSLGFSRQERWSGLRFPSPRHESEKWKWSHSVVSDPQWPHGLQPSRLLHPWDFLGRSTGVGCHCLLHIYIVTLQCCVMIFRAIQQSELMIHIHIYPLFWVSCPFRSPQSSE